MHSAITISELERRLKILLPPEYQERYEEVQPVSMGSTGLRYGADGRVAWDMVWGSFCDLAMAGGPPHRGALLVPGRSREVATERERYREVVTEICRGITLLNGLQADAAPVAGWVRMYCPAEVMAGWLARAISMENISVYVQGSVVCLPTAAHYRVEKEIKNVLTAVAKTSHYWMGHMSSDKYREVAKLLMKMERESPLLQPALQQRESRRERWEIPAAAIAAEIRQATGLTCAPAHAAGWIGVDCASVESALWVMRILVACNMLARREGTIVFAPFNPVTDSSGTLLIAGVCNAANIAGHSTVSGSQML